MKLAITTLMLATALVASGCSKKGGGSGKLRPRGAGAAAGQGLKGAAAPVADNCPANAEGKFENETLSLEFSRNAESKLEITIGNKGEEPYVLTADGVEHKSSETDTITVTCDDSKIKTDGTVSGVRYTSTYTVTNSAVNIEQSAPAQKSISLVKVASTEAPADDDSSETTDAPNVPGVPAAK